LPPLFPGLLLLIRAVLVELTQNGERLGWSCCHTARLILWCFV
jgi:hypothetical protein